MTIYNGDMLRLAPGKAEKIDSVESGRLYKDGAIVGDLDSIGVVDRRKLAFAGLFEEFNSSVEALLRNDLAATPRENV